eukprot:GEMP01052921.1.p1 GENE.GEMP01052921.1~~GEMP01052921.1.p1  ORF type:complete len:470 (+),score=106.12 GEMP01052921.1:103-1512(+)
MEKNTNMEPSIVLVGSGLVGSICARVLQLQGYTVHVYERYDDIRTSPCLGKSINLVMTARGLRAAELCGIKDDLLSIAKPVSGRRMHLVDETDTRFQPYGTGDECNYSVHRYELNKILITKAELAGVKFHFGHALSKLDLSGDQIHLEFSNGNKVTLPPHCPVIGSDGGPSAVRYALRDAGYITFSEDVLKLGYKEITFFANSETGDYCMDSRSLHIWPRQTHFLMGLPNTDNTFIGTIYSEEWPTTLEESKAFLQTSYATAIPLCGGLDKMATMLLENARGILGTVRTDKWYADGKACLIGDAAHAITPFFGQGCNCGFEDVVAMAECLASKPATFPEFEKCFAKYFAMRKENADAIADMALENMVEMREKVAYPEFLLHKKVEHKIEEALPQQFRSRYAMVCYGGHGGITYSMAKKLGEVQWEVIEEVAKGKTDPEEIDMAYAEKMIRDKVLPRQKELGVDLSTLAH